VPPYGIAQYYVNYPTHAATFFFCCASIAQYYIVYRTRVKKTLANPYVKKHSRTRIIEAKNNDKRIFFAGRSAAKRQKSFPPVPLTIQIERDGAQTRGPVFMFVQICRD